MVLHPAVAEMARRSAAYPYPVPLMQGPGYMGPYNYIRKPACDFGCAQSLFPRRPGPRDLQWLEGGMMYAAECLGVQVGLGTRICASWYCRRRAACRQPRRLPDR